MVNEGGERFFVAFKKTFTCLLFTLCLEVDKGQFGAVGSLQEGPGGVASGAATLKPLILSGLSSSHELPSSPPVQQPTLSTALQVANLSLLLSTFPGYWFIGLMQTYSSGDGRSSESKVTNPHLY